MTVSATNPKIIMLKIFTIICMSTYPIFDDASYAKTRVMFGAFFGYLAVYAVVRSIFNFSAPISYKRVMSVIESGTVAFFGTMAIWFDEENVGRSLIDGYQSKYAMLALNIEVGAYAADMITITHDQFAIFPLVMHHVMGIIYFPYASLRGISSLTLCYAVLQEACNPFWYAHMLMYGWRTYRKKSMQPIFFLNAAMVVLSYVIIRFIIVKPQSIISLYLIFFDCAWCNLVDKLWALTCIVSMIGINVFNLIKLCKSISKAWGEARALDKPTAGKQVKSH